jgi:N-succinyldiaminopimelate aminotransferase
MPHFPELVSTAQHMSAGVFGKTAQRSSSQPDRVFALNVGDTYLEPLLAARAEAQSSAELPGLHQYSATQGEPRLLKAIVDKLKRRSGIDVDQGRVQVMPGATAAMGIICSTLIDAGDEVIILAPFWPLIRGAVRARGARAVEVPLFTRLDEPGFDPVAAIEAAITPRTVAIYINAPNNPTGRVLPERALAQVAALAERHALWIISDEAYEDIWFGDEAPASVFARPDFAARTLATHSVSKAYALAGARVGYTHGPSQTMDTIRGVQTFYSYCAPRPMQFAAARAIEQGDAWLAQMRATYASAARAAARALEQRAPQGGTFLFFDLLPFMKRSEELSDILDRCAQAGVLLTPGTACGVDFATWARLCFTTVPEADLHEALRRLRAVLFTQS